jgi:hypothetical protein
MDGLPSMEIARKTGKAEGVVPIQKMVGPKAPGKLGVSGGYGRDSLRFVLVMLVAWTFVGAVYAYTRSEVLPKFLSA